MQNVLQVKVNILRQIVVHVFCKETMSQYQVQGSIEIQYDSFVTYEYLIK